MQISSPHCECNSIRVIVLLRMQHHRSCIMQKIEDKRCPCIVKYDLSCLVWVRNKCTNQMQLLSILQLVNEANGSSMGNSMNLYANQVLLQSHLQCCASMLNHSTLNTSMKYFMRLISMQTMEYSHIHVAQIKYVL